MSAEQMTWNLVRALIRAVLFIWFVWPIIERDRNAKKLILAGLLVLCADAARILPLLGGGGVMQALVRQVILIVGTYNAARILLKTQRLFAFYIAAVFSFSCAIWKNLLSPYAFRGVPVFSMFIENSLNFTQPARTVIETLAYFLTLLFIKKTVFNMDKNRHMQPMQVFLVLFPAFSNWIIMVALYDSFFYQGLLLDYQYGDSLMLVFVLLASSTIAVIMIAEWYFSINEKQTRLHREQRLLADSYNRMESQRMADENLRHLQHDMKNHLMTLNLIQGNSQQAKEYIDKLIGEIQDNVEYIHTGNATLDVVLAQKSQMCRENAIDLHAYVDFRQGNFIDSVEVCTLFANCLDNAFEAVSLEEQENRRIVMSCTTVNGCIVAKFSNPSAKGPVYNEGKICSTKEDEGRHGYGLASVEKIAVSYGGALRIKYENRMFQTMWMIPLPEKA